MAIPVLETARLRLRPHGIDDFEPLAAMWSDPLVVRHIGGRDFGSDEVWARLLRYAGMWPLLGYGFWAIEDKETGAYLGDIGLMEAKRAIDPPFTAPEAGWALLPAAHGRGIASEALAAVLEWADEQHFERTVCMIEPENAASLRVAEKLGFTEYARANVGEKQVHLFERRNPALANCKSADSAR
jgi:RimJ/RimL family protein N-acetyltransferase